MGIMYNTKTFSEIYESSTDFVTDIKTNFAVLDNISDAGKTVLYYLLFGRYGNSPISNWDETQFKVKMCSIMFQYGPNWEKKLSVQAALRALQDEDLVDGGKIDQTLQHYGTNGSTTTVDEDTTSTGTSSLAHTGTVGNVRANDVTDTTSSTDIANHALNPETTPATNAFSPLGYINDQTAEKVDSTRTTDQDETNTTTYNNTDTTTNNLAGTRDNTTTHTGNDNASDTMSRTNTKGILEGYEKLLSLLEEDVTNVFVDKFKILFKQFVGPEHPMLYVTESDN